ncbi:MAG: glycosyltransferase family 4 protein [Azospirillaceae bacterium]|nr:glycosyltransferase family 4 protein [Azospirillaceae bacterium]
MRITFLDLIPWDYDPGTPRRQPLGGSQSALCHLAVALADLGHRVRLRNNVSSARTVQGVECRPLAVPGMSALHDTDVLVVLNELPAPLLAGLRQAAGDRIRIVLWTQHGCDQPAAQPLRDPRYRDQLDALVLISGWQAETYINVLGLRPGIIRVHRNAPGPDYRQRWLERGGRIATKSWPPVLAYTSTPYRGLDLLLACFPAIRAAIPGTRLAVYSSMATYFDATANDPFAELYAQCRSMPGVDYHGAIAQAELADAMQDVSCLAYPNLFAETSCVAAMEAMAAGCLVVTSAFGALPETTAGFAVLVPPCADRADHQAAFTQATIRALRRLTPGSVSRSAVLAQLEHEARLTCEVFDWETRAREWQDMLTDLVAGPSPRPA